MVGGGGTMMYDSPSPEWYIEPEDEDHSCTGVWCNDRSHRDEDE